MEPHKINHPLRHVWRWRLFPHFESSLIENIESLTWSRYCCLPPPTCTMSVLWSKHQPEWRFGFSFLFAFSLPLWASNITWFRNMYFVKLSTVRLARHWHCIIVMQQQISLSAEIKRVSSHDIDTHLTHQL